MKIEKSWILYDIANSAFVLIIVTTIMPIFFKEYASFGFENTFSTANWGYGNSIASLVIAFLAPILGTLGDYKGFKKKFFVFFLLFGVFFTIVLSFSTQGRWMSCLIIFILARIGWSGANIFYDAFLVDVADKKRRNIVSSKGFAWGYVGSVFPFLLIIGLVFSMKNPLSDFSISIIPARLSFIIVAIWWFLLSVPMIKNVKQKYYIDKIHKPVKTSFLRLFRTLKKIKNYKYAFIFLIAYFFYIDGVNTIISMAAAYGLDIGLDAVNLIFAILMIQVVAFPCALIYGKLSEKYTAKTMILIGIGVYSIITFIGFFLPVIESNFLKKIVFWFLSLLVASSMGGIQALSRSLFSNLIPEKNSAEFFGFYNVFGKFAMISGPFIMGLFTNIFGHSRYGVLSIFALFLTGGLILLKINVKETRSKNA